MEGPTIRRVSKDRSIRLVLSTSFTHRLVVTVRVKPLFRGVLKSELLFLTRCQVHKTQMKFASSVFLSASIELRRMRADSTRRRTCFLRYKEE